MFSFTTSTWAAISEDSSSRCGAIALQGPHHSAQKSTSTGLVAFSTSCSKLASLTGFVICALSFVVACGALHRGHR